MAWEEGKGRQRAALQRKRSATAPRCSHKVPKAGPPLSAGVGEGAPRSAHQVVDDVGQGPDDRDAEEGDAEQDHMQQRHQEDVGQPDAPAVHHAGVGVHLAVGHPHVHPAGLGVGRESAQALPPPTAPGGRSVSSLEQPGSGGTEGVEPLGPAAVGASARPLPLQPRSGSRARLRLRALGAAQVAPGAPSRASSKARRRAARKPLAPSPLGLNLPSPTWTCPGSRSLARSLGSLRRPRSPPPRPPLPSRRAPPRPPGSPYLPAAGWRSPSGRGRGARGNTCRPRKLPPSPAFGPPHWRSRTGAAAAHWLARSQRAGPIGRRFRLSAAADSALLPAPPFRGGGGSVDQWEERTVRGASKSGGDGLPRLAGAEAGALGGGGRGRGAARWRRRRWSSTS